MRNGSCHICFNTQKPLVGFLQSIHSTVLCICVSKKYTLVFPSLKYALKKLF